MRFAHAVRAWPLWIRAMVVALIAAVVAEVGVAVVRPTSSDASSHREAPLISADPQADNTDVYAFVSPDDPSKVTILGNWIPFEEPAGGPNFFPFATKTRYDFKIDNDGDARADITYRWLFHNHRRDKRTFLYNDGEVTSLDDENLNIFQTYDLVKIANGRSRTLLDEAPVVPSYVGDASMPDYASLRDEGISSFGAGRSFTGQAEDPFYLDLRVFDLVYGGDFSEVGDDTLAGFNVNTIALQVPKAALAAGRDAPDNPVIGVWSSTARKRLTVLRNGRAGERFVQVSRLGMPLTNEVIIPTKLKNRWNRTRPVDDAPQFVKYHHDPILARVINAVYGLPIPDSNPEKPGIQRADLISVFMRGIDGLNRPEGRVRKSDQLRLNMGVPPCEPGTCPEYSRLGVIEGDNAGFPNGRRLGDDVIDIALQVMEGELLGNENALGDGVNSNDVAFGSSFPHVALPHAGSEAAPHN